MDIARFGNSKISYCNASNPIELTTKEGEKLNLLELCQQATPPCHLNPFLFNGHLQTFWTAVRSFDIPMYYKRRVFEAEESTYAGSFAVDFVVPPFDETHDSLPPRTIYYTDSELNEMGSPDSNPMLVTLHGLSGGSHEIYVRSVLWLIRKEGWNACVVNARGCAKSSLTSGVLYNARATWDIRQVVKWLRNTFPNRPLFGIGFSLGANILVNYLGEEGASCLLKAAVVCSNPWNLEVGSLALQRSWVGLEVYSKIMGGSMRDLFESHIEELSKNSRVNVAEVRKVRYLHEFDRVVQGPTWGYPTEGAYYRDASSCDSLLAVRIPLFAINAEDDPIVAREAIPFTEFTQNPFAVLCTTALGGHLGWFELDGGRWFAKPAVQFLVKMASIADLSQLPKGSGHESLTGSQPSVATSSFQPMRRRLHVKFIS